LSKRSANSRARRRSKAPPCDKRAIARIAARLGALMRSTPEMLDIEINPLVAYPEGALALDALMITAETAGKTG
jgi:acetate---CoA ligase (ADP-forming)